MTSVTPQTISCNISGLSAPAKIKWIKPDGGEVAADDTRNYVFDDGKDGFVGEEGSQTTKLTLEVPVVENIETDSVVTYECSVESGEFLDAPSFSRNVVIKRTTYEITGVSHDILAGSLGMLTCSVTGISTTDTRIIIVWADENGTIYDESSSDADYSVTEEILPREGKLSTLTLSEKVTAEQDRIFTCRVTVGTETEPADLEIPLKTFTVRTVEAEVELGQSATLTCLVIGPTDTLTIMWYLYGEDEVGGTLSNSTTASELILEEPKNDAMYTCQVSGQNTYTFDVELVVNDITLNPEGQIRAFANTVVNMTCSFRTTTISEGSFHWIHNGRTCTSDDCRNTTDSAKSSTLTIIVANETAGEWTCSFTKAKNNRRIRTSPLQLISVRRSGAQSPVILWGRIGEEAKVSCTVPLGLNYSSLTVIEWTLNGYLITEKKLGPSNNSEESVFTFGDKTESDTDLIWSIKFRHSTATEGTLQCRVAYDTGEQMQIPSSRVNLMTLTSDVESILMTPNSGAEVTFITRAKYTPTTIATFSNGTYFKQSSKQETGTTGGVVYKEVIRFSSSLVSLVSRKENLKIQVFPYKYTVNSGQSNEMSLTGKAFLVGETFVDSSPVWGTIGGRTKLTAHFTALDISNVKVTWQQRRSEVGNEWVDVASNGSSTMISELDDKNVMSTIMVIDKLREPHTTQYRAKVEIAGSPETTGLVTVNAASAIATVEEVKPVFEMENVSFTVTIINGPSELTIVTLVQKEAGKEFQVNTTGIAPSYPFEISHQMIKVYSCDQGVYFFKVSFASGLKLETNKVELIVRRKCRPLTAPPNTVLSEVDVPNSDNYKVTVTCREKERDEQYDIVLMDDEKKEALCDTVTGTYNTNYITPCLKVVDPGN